MYIVNRLQNEWTYLGTYIVRVVIITDDVMWVNSNFRGMLFTQELLYGLRALPAHRERWELQRVVGQGQSLQIHPGDGVRETADSVVGEVELSERLKPEQIDILQSVVAQM